MLSPRPPVHYILNDFSFWYQNNYYKLVFLSICPIGSRMIDIHRMFA